MCIESTQPKPKLAVEASAHRAAAGAEAERHSDLLMKTETKKGAAASAPYACKVGESPSVPTVCKVGESSAKMRKLGKAKGRKSVLVDREFLSKTKRYARAPEVAPSLSSPIRGITTQEPDADAHRAEERESESSDDLFAWREGRPRPWRDTTDAAKIAYYGRELARRGSFYPFAVHLDPARIDWSKPLDLIRRKLAYHFERKLGRVPEFWVVAEFGADGTLHLQGHVGIDDEELAAARTALHGVAKGWREGRGKPRAVWIERDSRTDGWGGYCEKALEMTRAEFDRRRRELQVDSKRAPVIVICSDDLRRAAEDAYENDRSRFRARRFSWRRWREWCEEPHESRSQAVGAPRMTESPKAVPASENAPTATPGPGAASPIEPPVTSLPGLPQITPTPVREALPRSVSQRDSGQKFDDDFDELVRWSERVFNDGPLGDQWLTSTPATPAGCASGSPTVFREAQPFDDLYSRFLCRLARTQAETTLCAI